MIDNAHHEKHFEAYVVKKLKAQGWLIGTTAGYDIEHALYPEDLVWPGSRIPRTPSGRSLWRPTAPRRPRS